MTLSVVELRSGISLPQLGDRAIWELDDQGVVHSPLGEDEEDPYQEFLDEHSDRQDATLHQLGGYALWAQDDPRSCTRRGPAVLPQPDWQLMWQIDSDSATHMMWDDGGSLSLMLRNSDLGAGRFDQGALILQSR